MPGIHGVKCSLLLRGGFQLNITTLLRVPWSSNRVAWRAEVGTRPGVAALASELRLAARFDLAEQ